MILAMSGGGAESQLASLAAELSRRGHDIHIAFVYDGIHSQRLAGSGCTLHRLGPSSKYDPRFFPNVLSLVRRLRPDVLQTWLTHMDIAGGGAARLLGVPWVMSERSAAVCYAHGLLNRLRTAAGRRANLIVANSQGGADYWAAHGVASLRIEVVPNFVPLTEIDSADRLDDSRLAPGDELIVYVGRLVPEKNLELIIDALPLVFASRPYAKFAFCGEGPLLGDLMARSRNAGLNGRVIFPGFVPNVGSWLKRASAAVAVSLYEGHPNAVLEAMAAGVPVIVSDIPAFRAILDADSASFVPSHDTERIAGAIVETLEDRGAAMRRAARARAGVAALSLDGVVTRYEAIYQRVAAGGNR